MRKQLLKTAICIAATIASLSAPAQPTMLISDGVTSSGLVTGANGSVVYVNPAFGDNWSVVITAGTTKPLFGSAMSPDMELTIQATCTGPGNDLTVYFSDNNFGPVAGRLSGLLSGQFFGSSGGALTFNTFYDLSNQVMTVTSPLTASGPVLPDASHQYASLIQGGTISGTPVSLSEAVTLSGSSAASYSLSATLQALGLACAGGSGQVGVPYSSALTPQGGTPPYTFSVLSGSLPPGLMLDTNSGTITGTPTAAGAFPYVARVADASARTADTSAANCGLTVGSSLTSLNVLCAGGSGQIGVPYSSVLGVSGGTAPYTFSFLSGSLPPGLMLDTNSGAITGTPTAAGAFPYVARVVDGSGRTADTSAANCGITIPATPSDQPAIVITDGVTSSGPITGANGSVVYINPVFGDNWSVVITAGTTKPLFGNTVNPNMELTIQATCMGPGPDLTIYFSDNSFGPSTGDFAALLDGQAVSGPGAPVTFKTYYDPSNSLLTLTLPLNSIGPLAGPVYHALDQAGSISANPYALTEVVTISGAVASSYSLGANLQSLSLACAGGAGQVGTPYTNSLVASGGCTPYTNFVITFGALPPGLSLNPATGDITGTPTAAGTFPYVAQVTDCAGRTASTTNENCAITVGGCTGQIGDFVWNDLNSNGCQDAGEPGIPNVTVDLYSGCGVSGTAIATTTTDNTGHYLFSGLCPGTYTVSFNTPNGYTRTIAHAACANNANPPESNQTDSKCDCAPGTPCGVCVTLTTAAPVNLNVDCGYVCNGQIGDYVWNDLNGNGCQDAGEPGLPGVKVDLYSGCGVSGTLIGTTNTDNAGHYVFGGLCAGTYTVSFNTPAGFTRTVTNSACAPNGGPPYSSQTDSKCVCAPGTPCGVCVVLTPANPVNLNVDCGYVVLPSANCVAISAVQGVAITPVTMIGSGGCGGPYTFASTNLPSALTLSSGGTISGTPAASGTFSYTVIVTDNCGNSGTVNCSVTVKPPVSANCVTITAVQGIPITSVTLVGGGGCGGPYTFASTNLPTGLTMSSGGTISGTPTVNGTFNYTVTITDACGNKGTINCSVTVKPPVSANCVTITAVQGIPITPVTLVGSGGCGGPYTFASTNLPSGLTMSSGGTISGTPTVNGTFNYTVTITDACGNKGTLNCSVTVNPPPCSASIAGTIRCDCDFCICSDRDHDDRDHDGRDHSKCNHRYNECRQDGHNHSTCRHERGWCSFDGKDHSKCNHANNICKVDKRDHSWCHHEVNICNHDGYKHAECDHSHSICKHDGRDHSGCNHKFKECNFDGKDHSACRHAFGWCSRDGRNHSTCNHAAGICRVDTRDHSQCDHSRNICLNDGHDHSLCDHGHTGCKFGCSSGQCTLQGFTVQLKNSAGTTVLASQVTPASGAYIFTNLTAGTYQVVVSPLTNYVQFCDPDSTLDSKTTITLTNCQPKVGVDFCYKKVLCAGSVSGTIYGICGHCTHNDLCHDDRDHDGCDHSKCNHKYNMCSRDGQDHSRCRHERGWCNYDGKDHSRCNHAAGYCRVDTRDHSACNHSLNICVNDGYKHVDCDHAHGKCSHDGRDHSTCNHKYGYCSLDGQDHSGCRHERGWCNRDGKNHSACDHAKGVCAVDTRDHSQCDHARNICVQDGHNHSGCNHALTGCFYGFSTLECGLQGFTVQLKNSAGTTVLATQVTGKNGFYVFSNLVAGTYQIVVSGPTNYTQISDPDCVLDGKATVTLACGQVKTCEDFGYRQLYIMFRGAASGRADSGVLSLTIAKPAGTQPSDVMVASVGGRPNTQTITAPAGWTLVTDLNNNNSSGNPSGLDVYYKVAGTSEPASYTWSFSTSAGSAGGILSFCGVDTLQPIDVKAGQLTSVSLSQTAPSVTTQYANDMLVASIEIASSASFTTPSGMTEAFDVKSASSTGSTGVSIQGSYRLQKTIGSSGTITATASNDADTGNTHTLALKAR